MSFPLLSPFPSPNLMTFASNNVLCFAKFFANSLLPEFLGIKSFKSLSRELPYFLIKVISSIKLSSSLLVTIYSKSAIFDTNTLVLPVTDLVK